MAKIKYLLALVFFTRGWIIPDVDPREFIGSEIMIRFYAASLHFGGNILWLFGGRDARTTGTPIPTAA